MLLEFPTGPRCIGEVLKVKVHIHLTNHAIRKQLGHSVTNLDMRIRLKLYNVVANDGVKIQYLTHGLRWNESHWFIGRSACYH